MKKGWKSEMLHHFAQIFFSFVKYMLPKSFRKIQPKSLIDTAEQNEECTVSGQFIRLTIKSAGPMNN